MNKEKNCEDGYSSSILMCEYEYDEGIKRIMWKYRRNEKSPLLPLYFSPISILTTKKPAKLPYMKSFHNNKSTREQGKIAAWKKSRVGKIHNFFSYACRSATNSELERRQGFFPTAECLFFTATLFPSRYDIKQYFLGFSIPVFSAKKYFVSCGMFFIIFPRNSKK